jgi:hypothetical protein
MSWGPVLSYRVLFIPLKSKHGFLMSVFYFFFYARSLFIPVFFIFFFVPIQTTFAFSLPLLHPLMLVIIFYLFSRVFWPLRLYTKLPVYSWLALPLTTRQSIEDYTFILYDTWEWGYLSYHYR